MEHPKDNNTTAASTGQGVPIVNINGARVKKIREEKGLTQLYLSEVVGVTTDTISRWENRRYPSIKLENAKNLAQALEVELEEILEKSSGDPGKEIQPPQVEIKKKFYPRTIISLTLSIILAGIISGMVIWYFFPADTPAPDVSAIRILPPHVPPGQIFPVLIRVNNPSETSIALIIKETVPPGTGIETGVPSFTTINPEKNELKWISRTENRQSVFAYLARASRDAAGNTLLIFNGSITLKQKTGSHTRIDGNSSISISPYHWADTNKDEMIDDEEILAVYDLYSDIREIGFNRDLIDDIWAGSGYRWDEKKEQYVVLD